MYQGRNDASRHSMVCDEGVRKIWKSYVILLCAILLAYIALSFRPILVYFEHGTLMTPLGTRFPNVDQSKIAFYTDLFGQTATVISSGIGLIAIEMCQVIINNAIEMSADIMQFSAMELNEQLNEDSKMNHNYHIRFHNIIHQVQDFDRYLFCFSIKKINSVTICLRLSIKLNAPFYQIYFRFYENFLLANTSCTAGTSNLYGNGHFYTKSGKY